MDLRVSTCFVMLTYCFWCGDARYYNMDLRVRNGGEWGDWGKIEYCKDGYVNDSPCRWGTWSNPTHCPKGHLISFQLQVEHYQGPTNDDTAANNIRFMCSGGIVLTGDGHNWGTFDSWSKRCSSGAICGLVTSIEPPQGSSDDTALNDVIFLCCD